MVLLLLITTIVILGFIWRKKYKEEKVKQALNTLKKSRDRREEIEEKLTNQYEVKREKFNFNNYDLDSITESKVVTETKVVGVSHISQTGRHRQDLVRKLENREIVDLIHQKDNPEDPKAIAVVNSDGHDIGFLPKELASKIHDQLQDYEFFAIVKFVTGYGMPTKGVEIKILRLEK